MLAKELPKYLPNTFWSSDRVANRKRILDTLRAKCHGYVNHKIEALISKSNPPFLLLYMF